MSQSAITRIILFDGECVLCNKAVQTIIKRDPNRLFKFASLQSPVGKSILSKTGLGADTMNSIILLDGNNYFTKSSAVLAIIKELNGYSVLYPLLKLLPSFLLDIFYTVIAKVRYKLFGKTKNCVIYEKDEFTQRIAG